jgi:diaminohydroxyphosphoribosylaminopyrimidine deaminase/5-amino-6-(5-phosphoribosylamino)uracil reductase
MHKQFMMAALKQAHLGRGNCAPNPSVGAVLVHQDKIISSAYHQGVGTAHAEHIVIQQVIIQSKNTWQFTEASLYVTLEPCNHWGRTPPCVAAIINAGIKRVIYGFRDPNPLVASNKTPEQLIQAGIEVIHLPLLEIDMFYQSYDYWTHYKKPFVTAKMAHSLDGKIAGIDGIRWQLSNEQCAEFTHQQRLATDVILTSARTIINDKASFTARVAEQIKPKVLAIIDTNLSLAIDTSALALARHCHIYHDKQVSVIRPHDNCSYHKIPTKNKQLDLCAIIKHLGHMGKHDVWVEAGGHLFSALHEQDLVQRTYLYIVPTILGTQATSVYQEKNFFSRPHTIVWQPQADNMIACLNWQEASCLPD